MDYQTAQSGIIGGASLGYAKGSNSQQGYSEPVETSPFILAGMAFSNAGDLVRRVQSLADRLTGSVPTPVNPATAKAPMEPPTFSVLRHGAEMAIDEIGDAMRALDRIERALP